MKLPPTILIQEDNFHNAWARAVRYVLRDGLRMTIGDSAEPKPIKDACALFELTGDAIRQIENRELHPQFPFRHIDQYCEEFTRAYLSQYIKKPDQERFSYLYFERLAMYGDLDQIEHLRKCLALQKENGIASNRDQVITWQPKNDLGSASPPCLQRVWIEHLGDDSVEVHLTWRSRDLYTAWQVNIIALIDMLNREVIRPNNCRIVKLVDYVDSLHIYESDKDAERVKLLPASPQKQKGLWE
jgi:thymidylate synthase